MKSRWIPAVTTTIGLLAATGETSATGRLSLKVTPNVSSAPSTVVVRAIVARDAGNRWLHIEADSGAFYRSSDVELDGEKAPVVTEFRFDGLPGGEYTVAAVLRTDQGDQTIVRRTLLVLSRAGEP